MPGKEKPIIDLKTDLIRKIVERHLNITSILNNFKSLIKQVYQKGCTHKFNKKSNQNNYLRPAISQR